MYWILLVFFDWSYYFIIILVMYNPEGSYKQKSKYQIQEGMEVCSVQSNS